VYSAPNKESTFSEILISAVKSIFQTQISTVHVVDIFEMFIGAWGLKRGRAFTQRGHISEAAAYNYALKGNFLCTILTLIIQTLQSWALYIVVSCQDPLHV